MVHEVAGRVADVVALRARPPVLAAVLHPHPQLVPEFNGRGCVIPPRGKWFWALPVVLDEVALVRRGVGEADITYVALVDVGELLRRRHRSRRKRLPRRLFVEYSL